MFTTMNDKLKVMIEQSSLTQKEIAAKLGTNQIHLNKVLNGKASLTTRMAKKLATIPELKTTEQDLVYPPLPLDIAGSFYVGQYVRMYKTSRPSLYVPTPIKENYFGVIFQGHDNDSHFTLNLDEGECMVFDGWFEKHKEIDPSYLGKMNIIECPKNKLYVGWLDEKSKSTGKYGFNRLGTSSWENCEVLWASTFIQSWNLSKLEGTDNLIQLD